MDIPSPEEVRAFLAALDGRWRPILLTAVFTGLRASELRGLRWTHSPLAIAQIGKRHSALAEPAIFPKWRENVVLPQRLSGAVIASRGVHCSLKLLLIGVFKSRCAGPHARRSCGAASAAPA
jgi:integrase